MKIKELIDKRKEERTNKSLKANPVFASTQGKLINLIDCYWNSKFSGSSYDSRGFRKPFLNAVRVPTFVGAKATDLDTKNIRTYSQEGQDFHKSYIFNKELKFYFRENHFDLLLNQITWNRPKYGHIILKKVKDKIYFVPIENDYSGVETEGLGNPMVEYHEYDFDELRKMNWDNIEKAISLYDKMGKDKVCCWEITGKVDDTKNNYNIITASEYGETIYLVSSNVENNYKQLKWEDVPGRHQGRGVVEEQFESQIAINENEYLFRLGLQWTSKKLFQTRDTQIVRNLLSDALNGDVLTVNSPLEPVALEERNLSAFAYADNKWQSHSQSQSFATDIMQGKRPPSGTPAATSILQAQQAGGYYDLKRQDYGIFIKDVVEDWILPDFKKDKSKAHEIHLLKLLGNDNGSNIFFNAILGDETNKKVVEFMSKGKILSSQELQLLKGLTAEQMKNKNIMIPDNFYDFEYQVDVVVTGEQIDLSQRATALQTALQVIGSNPTVLQDPTVRRLYFKLLEATGVSPGEIFDEDIPSFQTAVQATSPAQVGGSIARPTPQPTMPAIAKVPTTVG